MEIIFALQAPGCVVEFKRQIAKCISSMMPVMEMCVFNREEGMEEFSTRCRWQLDVGAI